MASTYRTKRNKIVDAYVKELEGINGQSPYNSNIFNSVEGHTVFIDQITQYPKVCVVAEMKHESICLMALNGGISV